MYLDFKQNPIKCIEMAPKIVQFCNDPPKNNYNFIIPPQNIIFLKPRKNIEIENFEPPKMVWAYVYMKISENQSTPAPGVIGGPHIVYIL